MDQPTELPQQFPYPKGGALRHLSIGLFISGASVGMQIYGWELFGIQIPSGIVATVAVLGGIVGLALTVRALMRTFSDDPAVEITEKELRLYTHPLHRVVLRREDIVMVDEIEDAPAGQVAIYGDRVFHIGTTASGVRKMVLFIGERAVDAPLSKVREAVKLFVGS